MLANLAQRVRQFLERHSMLQAGDRIAVAVSGGADSVALLLLLEELRERLGIVLCVLHFNHQLRGKASDADEAFVKKLAAACGLEFSPGRRNVAAEARRAKANLEDTARRLRYAFFEEAVAANRATRVAVAHTADDQAETLLAHLIRGTGPAGLAGIFPVAGLVIRPLLGIRRTELRAYLKAKKQPWREDATNRDTTRLRARVRRKLLPLLERHFQPGVVMHLAQLADLAREDEAMWTALAADRCAALATREPGALSLRAADLLAPLWARESGSPARASGRQAGEREAQRALSKRLVRRIVKEVKGEAGQLTSRHVAEVLRLAAEGTSGHALDLPGGVRVEREFERLIFRRRAEQRPNAQGGKPTHTAREYEYRVTLGRACGATVRISEIGSIIRLKVIDWPPDASETRQLAGVLDLDRLRQPLVLRNWRPGDTLRPQGRRHERKLKRLLMEKRVGFRARPGWPVLVSGNRLAWARGFPVADDFAPRKATRAGVIIAEESL